MAPDPDNMEATTIAALTGNPLSLLSFSIVPIITQLVSARPNPVPHVRTRRTDKPVLHHFPNSLLLHVSRALKIGRVRSDTEFNARADTIY